MNNRNQRRGLYLAIAMSLTSLAAAAAELYGVQMPESIKVEGRPLQLNGIGVRTKTLFAIKVYVAALYLEQRSNEAAQIIATDSLRRIDLCMTHDASSDKLGDELRTGFERNSKELKQRLERLLTGVPDLDEGQCLSITYVPGHGTTVQAAGTRKVSVPGKDFGDAVVQVWLGKYPLDAELKQRLLGGGQRK